LGFLGRHCTRFAMILVFAPLVCLVFFVGVG
jgi:hypothetical protein